VDEAHQTLGSVRLGALAAHGASVHSVGVGVALGLGDALGEGEAVFFLPGFAVAVARGLAVAWGLGVADGVGVGSGHSARRLSRDTTPRASSRLLALIPSRTWRWL
jgi:hypothetical protein